MKKELREYLLTIGLRSAATDKKAWVFYRSLKGDQNTRAREIRGTRQTTGGGGNGDGDGGTPGDGNDPSDPAASGEGTRSQQNAQSHGVSPEQAVANERSRVAQLRSLFNDDQPELLRRAIDEGWEESRAANELLSVIRNARSQSVGAAIHSRGGNANTDVLQAALLLRAGVALDNRSFGNTNSARAMNLPAWMRQDINSDERQQIMDDAHSLGPMSMVDMCRHSLIAAGHQVPVNRDDMIRAAFETRSLEPIYTTNVNARLLASYSEARDTTEGWTMSIDFDDFKENELATMGKMGRLTRHGRGKTADLMDRDAEMEPMKIFRYSGQYQLDEIDIINNRLGNPESDSPEEMGRSAKQTEIDLVYSVLLGNSNLVKDGTALFAAAEGNDFTGAGSVLEVLALETAITAMMDQRQRGRSLNLEPAFLLVPPKLKFHALRILNSATLLNLAAGVTNLTGSANVVSNEQVQVVADSRLGIKGVFDPFSETQIDGNDAQWFLTAAPGVGGAKTVAKGYRTGTGRMPQVRPFQMSRGTWGIGWDIAHDVGAKAVDRLGMQRHASDQ